MIKNWELKLGILFFVFFVLFGCASLPPPEVIKAEVATYQVPKQPGDGEAIVYIVRPSSYFGSVPLHVFLDNQEPASKKGSTIGEQYICFTLQPGDHRILSQGENWAETNVSAKEGDMIFIKQEAAMPILRGARNTLSKLNDYEGKYHVKTLTMGTIINHNQTAVSAVMTQARPGQTGQAGAFMGTVTSSRWVKGFGFSNMNAKLEVTSESGEQAVFYVRSDSKVFDANGNPINYLEASRSKGKKVEIQHFIIQDGTGGEPGRSDFGYEIGQKGVVSMRFLN